MSESICLPKYPAEEDIWKKISKINVPILVYGMGNGADKLIAQLSRVNREVADFFASDGFVRGHSFHGKRVLSFSEAREKHESFVILVSFATRIPEVMKMISDMGKDYELYGPDMPVVDEQYFTSEFYNAHYSEIKKAYDALSDELSKNLFAAIVNYKLTAEVKYLESFTSSNDEMYSLLNCEEIECAVDAGAYNGDTAKEMISYFPRLKELYAFEPDPKNCKKLKKLAQELDFCNLTIFESALWREDGEASFSSSNNRNSSLSNASFESQSVKVCLSALDNKIDRKPDYIKYDVEGAEMEALKGSMKTIISERPSLLVSAYHKSEDVFSLLNYLQDSLDGYSFFLRRKACFPAWEINLYAIPDEKNKNKYN